ncbi:MAG: RlmE family RNA methyltransferase [Deltaproteobacteria bacterium]|jgi:23S rRNA (uridine2552-2'-O)-methyltransferase|nr:RlmE family RNA methyltransferase [Deltaproteobacteria bacterium]
MVIKDRKRLDDYYSEKARKEGYPARSVYKLIELDLKYNFIKKGQKVLDLGAAPGSFSLYAAKKVGPIGLVLAVDLIPLSIKSPNLQFVGIDILEKGPEDVRAYGPFSVVLSDLAPKTTGVKTVDGEKSLALAKRALEWATELLAPKGDFLVKLFQGGDCDAFVKESLKIKFQKVILLKPKATRKNSVEIYALGQSFCGKEKA